MIALLDATLKVSAIVLLALATVRVWRGRSAAARHWLLGCALASAAVAPLVTLTMPSWRMATPVLPAGSVTVAYETGISLTAPNVQAPALAASMAAGLVIAVWLTGLVIGLLILVAGLCRLAWIERRATPIAGGRWLEIAADVAGRYALAAPPRLLQSDRPALLVTWGFRPKVVLPAGAAAWTDDRIRVVLAHELAHVRRRDWLVQLAAELLRAIYWFNPLLWIGCARLRQEGEQACDDAVLRLGVTGTTYATHLLDLARGFRAHSRPWVPASAIARPSSLERRVQAMLNMQMDRRPVTPLAAGAVLVAFLGVTASIASFDAFAQARFATISGAVVDQSGGVLVDATLVLSNVRTNAKNEVRTNATGFYEFVGLPAGDYEIEVRQLGFQSAREAVSVGVGEILQRNFSLQVGAVQETITMTGDAAAAVPAEPRVAVAPARRPCPNPAVGGCIRPPVKVKDVRPIYPASLREAGVQGVVRLEATIANDGRTNVVRVVSAPHPALERAAIDAVSQWEFAPTTLNGSAIDTPMNISVTFRLPETAGQP